MSVFVLDRSGTPLMPCSEKRARLLLGRGRARVHRLVPFAIRLVDRQAVSSKFQPLQIKLDPGSKTTGIALVRINDQVSDASGEVQREAAVLNLFELLHRGRQISEALTARRQMRRRRRGANLRYRAPRFDNRRRPEGWLAPSLRHRVDTAMTWVDRLRRWAPIAGISTMLHRFDTQKLQNPEISGIEYQQGELFGYEVREYLLEKWGRECAYCDAEHTPLTIDHIHPRSAGGSDRVSNLTLACFPCNQRKSNQDVRSFLAHDPERLARIEAYRKAPLRDGAAANSTRWALYSALKATGLQVETGTGGLTKWNRARLGIPKTHALDAACVGQVDALTGWRVPTLSIKCTGRGSYQRTRLDKFGFPRGYLMRSKAAFGFQTGDIVRASVPKGKNTGVHVGRVAVRARGNFNIQSGARLVTDVSHKHCRIIQRADGYGYALTLNLGKPNFPNSPSTIAAAPPARSRRDLSLMVQVPFGV